jgi:acyl-CoA synthetase (AMP-forming)/AMP-acid ligase II
MGLVGCFLSPIANQLSVDYLKTEDFARRPLAWLDLITRNPGTTLSYSPTFGYDICARRMSSQTRAEDRFDLSRWRIAGNGADMIRPDVMQAFVDAFADAGFKASAFCPSYGLAEATLAVSLMPPGEGIRLELVEESELSGVGTPDQERPRRFRAIVNCGKPVAGMEIEVRDANGACLPDRGIGKVYTRGSSVMAGYFRDEQSTSEGHDHHQRPQPLAAGHRMGRRAAARLQVGRHRGLRHHRAVWRGNARGPGSLPRFGPAGARPLARRHPRTRAGDHRHHPGRRAGAPPHPAPHKLGQAVAHQSAQSLPLWGNSALRHRRLNAPNFG